MYNFDLRVDSKKFQYCTYSISRLDKVYSYFKHEYPNIHDDGFDYLFSDSNRKSIIGSFIDRFSRKDFSKKILIGTEEHLYFSTEYPHNFMEDLEHNIIVPEVECCKIYKKKSSI